MTGPAVATAIAASAGAGIPLIRGSGEQLLGIPAHHIGEPVTGELC